MTEDNNSISGSRHASRRALGKYRMNVAVAILIVIAAIPIGRSAANYAGVCLKPFGLLSEEDQNRKVFNFLRETNVLTLKGAENTVVETIDNGFGYGSFEQFIRENKHCCTYSRKGPLNITAPLLRVLNGKHRSFVRVHYKPIWTVSNPSSSGVQERSMAISNCGVVDNIYQ